MIVHTRVAALVAAAGMVLGLPAAAQARTKVVNMGLPSSSQRTFNERYGVDVNDYFPHSVKIHVGDRVRFVPTGFHTMDLPPKGGGALPLVSPTGQKVAGVNDAAGMPFWFNGQDQLGFTPALLRSSFGKRFTYRGTKRIESGAPLAENVEPLVVKFAKAGSFRFFCDIHQGMSGVVRVVRKRARIPSRRQDARALKTQLARDLATAKVLPSTKVPAGTVDVGAAGPHGEEYYAMLPASLTVPPGTTLRFRMSPGSFDIHTATFGPGDPEREPNSYLGQIAASFQGNAPPDPKGVYSSESPGTTGVLTPLLHGNGFWNAGIMDRSTASPLPESNAVTFGAPGTYQFYCMIHPFMHGTIIVQ